MGARTLTITIDEEVVRKLREKYLLFLPSVFARKAMEEVLKVRPAEPPAPSRASLRKMGTEWTEAFWEEFKKALCPSEGAREKAKSA